MIIWSSTSYDDVYLFFIRARASYFKQFVLDLDTLLGIIVGVKTTIYNVTKVRNPSNAMSGVWRENIRIIFRLPINNHSLIDKKKYRYNKRTSLPAIFHEKKRRNLFVVVVSHLIGFVTRTKHGDKTDLWLHTSTKQWLSYFLASKAT